MTGRAASAAERFGSPPLAGGGESIQALATVTLDPRALDGLGPATMDRLADLVAARLADRRAAGEEALLTTANAAELAGVHPDTVRRAIHAGALTVAGYVGKRPRLRRSDIENWVASGTPAVAAAPSHAIGPRRSRRVDRQRVLGNALRALSSGAHEAGGRS